MGKDAKAPVRGSVHRPGARSECIKWQRQQHAPKADRKRPQHARPVLPGRLDRYVRHDLRIWESTVGREARLQGDDGSVLLGDDVLRDWRGRTQRGTARVRAYYDVLPAQDSELTLDASKTNEWGDPMPQLAFRDSQASRDLREHTEESIRTVFRHMASAGDGEILSMQSSNFQDHPAGGCRMGSDPATSVVDSSGRTHDHDNLFVIGAPTCVTGGCANGTLTFVALSLQQASQIGQDFPERSGSPPPRPGGRG